ncbi:MAG: tol-pal system protein YbgF [Acidobacteriota bacterium]
MIRFRRFLVAGTALLAVSAVGCTSSDELGTIHAQLDEIQVQLLELQKDNPDRDDLAAVESSLGAQLTTLLEGDADVVVELAALRDQIAALETKLEDTNFRLQQLSQQLTVTNQELAAVKNAAEVRARRPTAPPPRSTPSEPVDPRALYDSAYGDFQRGSFDLAILGFREYLENFPDTDLADNATYWIGESHYRQRELDAAVRQFDLVIDQWTRSDRLPSALLKKAFALIELDRGDEAEPLLRRVIRDYQGSDEARLAEQRLSDL